MAGCSSCMRHENYEGEGRRKVEGEIRCKDTTRFSQELGIISEAQGVVWIQIEGEQIVHFGTLEQPSCFAEVGVPP